VGDVVTAPFDISMGVWDTGFYEHSPCLRGMDKESVRKHITQTQKHIVAPVERLKGAGTLNHHENNKFFDTFVINLENKVIFNTAEPLQLLMLYLAVLGRQLAPKAEVGNPQFRPASFQVVNRDREVSNREQIDIDTSKATGEMYRLLFSDKDKLLKIFKYLGISRTAIQDENTFITVFNRYLQDKTDGYRNGKIFLDNMARFSTEEGENELNIYHMLNDLQSADVIKIVRQEYYLGDRNLGNTLKTAAQMVVRDDSLQRVY
jgi:hypothetical protein